MWQLRKENWLLPSKKKISKSYLDDAGKDKLLHWLLLSSVRWLMLARRLCVYNAGLKVGARREISTVVMMSYYENVRSCKRHTVVRRAFCFWRFTLLFLGLATHYRESWYANIAPAVATYMWLDYLFHTIYCTYHKTKRYKSWQELTPYTYVLFVSKHTVVYSWKILIRYIQLWR